MNLPAHLHTGGLRPRQTWLRRGLSALILLTMIFGPILVNLHLAAPVLAQTCVSGITLDIREYVPGAPTPGTGSAIANYSYLINVDNTADPFDPDPMQHPGVRPMPSYSPIAAAGNQSTAGGMVLEDGRYLISVRALDNPGTGELEAYKLWGKHVQLPDDCGTVLIELTREDPDPLDPGNPNNELPLSSIRAYVFRDWAPVNGFPDYPLEDGGLAGFHIVIHDVVGEVAVDWFGNPLCTQYEPGAGPGGLDYDSEGNPIPVPLASPTDAYCVTDANGEVNIQHIPYGKYEVYAIPPDGSEWIQTTTFEGTQAIDAWQEEGTDGRGAPGEILVEPNVATAYFFGFTAPCTIGDAGDACPDNNIAGSGTISGTLRNFVVFPPFESLTVGETLYKPWVTLNDVGNTDTQVARTRGDANGNFIFTNIPVGTYQVAIWDEPLDYIMTFYTVNVGVGSAATVDMGDVGVFRWFGWVSGDVFLDDGLNAARLPVPGGAANNGIRDCAAADPGNTAKCEVALPGIDLDIRFRDGSTYQATFTDPTGHYEYPEARGPLGKFLITEVGFGRFSRTGHSVHDDQRVHFPDADLDNDGIPNKYDPDLVTPVSDELGGGLLLNQVVIEGIRSEIDWGKNLYDLSAGENGGIAGIVFYAVTRNEFEARLAANEDYEPGVPEVTVRLYDATGTTLLNELQTDAWSHPSAGNPGGPGSACDVRDMNGAVITSGAAITIANNCIEVPMMRNETKAGAFDGGFQFESMYPSGIPGVGLEISPLPPGDYVVEVVTPPFYQILKEEDQNTDEGDFLQAIVPLAPPFPCVGPLHLVVDPRNPFDNTNMPLCNRRLVTLQAGQNAEANFFLFTDSDTDGDAATRAWTTDDSVPLPGRFFGLVENDIVVNTDPNSITYGEPRGVAGLPIGIYDYAGRKLKTIYTDENGFYEVLLPSSYTALCPIPSGVCPGMYVLVVNDPGDVDNPNAGFSNEYLTEPAVRDVWPGKMTQTDTPVDPINALVCSVPPNTPQIFAVSQPYATGALPLVITGTRFGDTLDPTVTLDDDDGVADPLSLAVVDFTSDDLNADPPIFEDVVTVTVPGGMIPGVYQLQVTNNDNLDPRFNTSLNGLSFHVLGAGYNPPLVTVAPPASAGTPVIQPAIDAAAPGSLIIVQPGTYHENVILHKNVKLQGYGPGGLVGAPEPEIPAPGEVPPTDVFIDPPFAHIQGSVIDGRYFQFIEANRLAWAATLSGPASPFAGPTLVATGAALTVVGNATEHGASFRTQVDGFGISSGRGEAGGGIYVHAYGRNMLISNNIFEGNSGGNGGAIVLGRPVADGGLANNENDNVRMHHNRILSNGGLRFAGGVGIYNGADNYQFVNNDVCGNFSLEYGGGLSHFGLSPNGRIADNLIYYNDAFDEGGGILVGGEQDVNLLGDGSGDVDITHNLIQANMSNDDGGGIRLLRPLDYRIDIVNNMIVDNGATDHGGGISLDDASNVTIVNNTIAFNVSTSTAEDRLAGPNFSSLPSVAGLSSELHSSLFTAPDGSAFSDPVLFNNIFWENEAMYWGLLPPEPEPGTEGGYGLISAGMVDMGVFPDPTPGDGDCLDPRFSMLSVAYGADGGACTTTDASNSVGVDPAFVSPFAIGVTAALNRQNLNEIFVQMLREEGTLLGFSDFHALAASLAIDAGTNTDPEGSGVSAPCDDFDHDGRPNNGDFDIGADEQPGTSASVTCAGTVGEVVVYFSTNSSVPPAGLINGDDADVYTFDTLGFFGRVFDATAAGIVSSEDIDALAIVGSTTYMSFRTAASVPGVGTVQDEDVVAYNGTTWSLYFDGTSASVGLNGTSENVDAFEILSNGDLVISADNDAVDVTGVTDANDEDLLRCVPTFTSGVVTGCSWSMYLEGSDIGLTGGGEDIDGVAVATNGDIYLSTNAAFSASGPSFSGGGEDVWVCHSPTTGTASDCTSYSTYYDGSGLTADDLDAFDLP